MKMARDSKLMRKYLSRVCDYPLPLRIKIDTERKKKMSVLSVGDDGSQCDDGSEG